MASKENSLALMMNDQVKNVLFGFQIIKLANTIKDTAHINREPEFSPLLTIHYFLTLIILHRSYHSYSFVFCSNSGLLCVIYLAYGDRDPCNVQSCVK